MAVVDLRDLLRDIRGDVDANDADLDGSIWYKEHDTLAGLVSFLTSALDLCLPGRLVSTPGVCLER